MSLLINEFIIYHLHTTDPHDLGISNVVRARTMLIEFLGVLPHAIYEFWR